MSKPTAVYGTILLLCAGGLWGILHAGSSLAAVSDLAGEWTIDDGPQGPGGLHLLGGGFTVEQSGRYFRVRFRGGQALDLRATEPPMGPIDRPIQWAAEGGGSRLGGTLRPDGDTVLGTFTLTGPTVARFVASRVPPKVEAKRAH